MKKLLCLLLALILCVAVIGCGDKDDGNKDDGKKDMPDITAEITVRDYGKITVRLLPEVAPATVDNFVSLAESGFYDGLTFHRFQPGFVMQGGDPNGNGSGDGSHVIKGEFAANGVNNTLSHTRGVLSMARAGWSADAKDPYGYNTASCQFFIVLQDSAKASLDGLYAGFGYVTEGMEIVDRIGNDLIRGGRILDSMGTLLPGDQPVIESVKIIRYQ